MKKIWERYKIFALFILIIGVSFTFLPTEANASLPPNCQQGCDAICGTGTSSCTVYDCNGVSVICYSKTAS